VNHPSDIYVIDTANTPQHAEDDEVTCPNCGRDHIPDDDEGQFHDTCVECLDGHGGEEG
jgi:hypothetical protein